MPSEVMVSTYEKALELARQGFYVFPSAHKKKHIKGWPKKTSRDPKKTKEWLGPGGTYESWKISIFTGKFGDGKSLVVVDIDPRHGGDETIRAIEAQHPDAFPPTREHRTAGGGSHWLYWTTWPGVKSGAGVLGPGVDIKSAGGLVHFGDGYELINDLPIAEASKYLLAQCKPVGSTSPHLRAEALPSLAINQEQAEARVIRYLENEAPLAIQGKGGDQMTFAVAARIKDFGVPEQAATMLMWEHWNERCSPSWAPDELETKVRNAYRYGQNPPGADAPEVVFAEPAEPIPEDQRKLHPFDKINAEFAYAIVGGESRILWETTDSNGHDITEHLTMQTLRDLRASDKMMKGNKEVLVVDEWNRWAGRQSYDGIVFDPQHGKEVRTVINGKEKRYFNEWRGFAVVPNPVSGAHVAVVLFLEHIRLNICRSNEELYRWLLGFLAHLFQRPWEKPRVALVLRGLKGVGKNFFVEIIGYLLGRHFLLTSNKRHLTGHFNSHFERCLLFCLDEAFWSGDKQAESTLKDLITGTDHFIERKGHEPYRVANKMRVIIIGNDDRLVPATPDERRYAVFDVGDHRRNDRPYFNKIDAEMKNGGYEALLHYLRNYDFSGIDVHTAPLTPGLLDQKILGLEPWLQYWRDCLRDGQIAGSGLEGWPSSIDCKRFQEAMRRALDGRNIKGWIPSEDAIGQKMNPLGFHRRRQRVPQNQRSPEDRALTYVYHIPELVEARRLFDVLTSQPTQWEPEA